MEYRITAKTAYGFMNHGNKKLKDFLDEQTGTKHYYWQFNLPAKTTCPYATLGCKAFCYAKTDERYTVVLDGRNHALECSKTDTFSTDLTSVIKYELQRKRYNNNHAILRIHESGDFYNMEYLKKWITIIRNITLSVPGKVTFQFYTKCFPYFLALSNSDKAFVNWCIANNVIGMSLSSDETMTVKQRENLKECKKQFPLANIYHAALADELEKQKTDKFCKCENCAGCGTCIYTDGSFVGVVIH